MFQTYMKQPYFEPTSVVYATDNFVVMSAANTASFWIMYEQV